MQQTEAQEPGPDRAPDPTPDPSAPGHRRRLVLHVGQTKTGSTAIQNYLESQRDALLTQGFLFPASVLSRKNPFDPSRTSGHLALMQTLRAGGDLSAFDAELADHPGATVVLSMENVFVDQPDAVLGRLGARFEGWHVTLVAVLRGFADWMRSIYVEETLSGFILGTDAFAPACITAVATGRHDYAARLDHLARLLRADGVRVLNYDAALAGDGAVPAFLAVAGLPVTDEGAARGIRANVREKDWFLVEGKRRLNHATGALKMVAQLELEAEVRAEGWRIASTLSAPSLFSDAPVPLTAQACAQIAASNRRLVRDFGLDPALPDPTPAPMVASGLPDQHRRPLPGVDALVAFGLQAAARLARRQAEAGAQVPGPLALPGIAAVIDLLAQARVSLHLDSPDTALWAACLGGRLPCLVQSAGPGRAEAARLAGLALPSAILRAEGPGTLATVLQSRPPTAVIVARGVPADRIAQAWALAGDRAVLALWGHDAAGALAVAEGLDLRVTALSGRVCLLAGQRRVRVGSAA